MSKAQSISFLLSQVRASGVALAGGEVEFFAAGTSTPKTIWLDRDKATPAANPYTLDSNGTAQLFADGVYRVVVRDSTGAEKYDRDGLSFRDASSNVYDVADYASLAAAVASIGSTPATLQFASDVTVSANLVIPANIELMPLNGAEINHTTYTISYAGSTSRWPLAQVFNGNGAVTGLVESRPEWFGAVGNGVTDDSTAAAGAVAALSDGGVLLLTSGKTYYFSNISTDKPLHIIGNGATIKHMRRALQNSRTWNNWQDPAVGPGSEVTTGVEFTIKFTAGADKSTITNLNIDANGIAYSASSGYPNQEVHTLWVAGADDVVMEGVHISNGNGNGVFIYDSIGSIFQNGSILNTRGITGATTSFDQILLASSQGCKVINSTFGGHTPDSAIATVGGKTAIADGTEVGGYLTFKDPDILTNNYTLMGYAIGDTDAFHEIRGNIAKSDILDATQAGGGGVLGRIITINSGNCLVVGNTVYDTTDLSQAGIGLGHEYVTSLNEPVPAMAASRSTVEDNTVFGLKKSGQGYGIYANGSEQLLVTKNSVYNCNTAIYHSRYALNSRYVKNSLEYNALAFYFQDTSAAKGHGFNDVLVEQNTFNGNTLDISTTAGLGISNWRVINNLFNCGATTENPIYIAHDRLDFSGNIINASTTGEIAIIYSLGLGSHVKFNNNTIHSTGDAVNELVFFDAASATTNRGVLELEGNIFSSDTVTNNRQLRIRMQSDHIKASGNEFKNTWLSVANAKSSDINNNQFSIIGTDFPISLVLSASVVETADVKNNTFKAHGSATATTCSQGAGSLLRVQGNAIMNNTNASNKTASTSTILTDNKKIAAGVWADAQ